MPRPRLGPIYERPLPAPTPPTTHPAFLPVRNLSGGSPATPSLCLSLTLSQGHSEH